jgi:hypothetical protein
MEELKLSLLNLMIENYVELSKNEVKFEIPEKFQDFKTEFFEDNDRINTIRASAAAHLYHYPYTYN